MPATSEKNFGGKKGKKKVISFRKNNHYLFPNKIFDTHNLNIYSCCNTLHNSYVLEQEQDLNTIIFFKHWVKALHKNTILLSPLSF